MYKELFILGKKLNRLLESQETQKTGLFMWFEFFACPVSKSVLRVESGALLYL